MLRDKNVRRPLFDRLTDLEPERQIEVRPARSLERRGLKESVRRELECLFNTRIPLAAEAVQGRPRTVLEYGVPDFSTYSPHNPDDVRRLEEHLREAVEAFEPRLDEVAVKAHTAVPGKQGLGVQVDAVMIIDGVREPVSFPTVFQEWRARVGLEDDG